jgi:hypothetical protein
MVALYPAGTPEDAHFVPSILIGTHDAHECGVLAPLLCILTKHDHGAVGQRRSAVVGQLADDGCHAVDSHVPLAAE